MPSAAVARRTASRVGDLRRRTSISCRSSSGVAASSGAGHDRRLADRRSRRRAGRRARPSSAVSVRRWRGLLLEGLDLVEQGGDPLGDQGRRDLQRGGDLGEDLLLLADVVERRLARQGGDPPRAGRDRLLADDLEQADLADVVEVRPAAELAREVAHRDDADDLGVLLAEEGHRAERPGLGDRHGRPGDRLAARGRGRLTVSSIGAEPVAADGLGVGEVEPEPVGLDLAAGLLGVLAQVGVQGVVQDVRRRVRPADRLAALGVDRAPSPGR